MQRKADFGEEAEFTRSLPLPGPAFRAEIQRRDAPFSEIMNRFLGIQR